MKLSNSFTIARPVPEVYQAFLDVERIATCMPGSRLLGQPEPGRYEGEVKVKVGPLGVAYSGSFSILEADESRQTLTMRAKGREQRGAGNADAHIVAALSEHAEGTLVQINTDLSIRGKVAQFGRGVIGEVTDGIMQSFAGNVEQMLSAPAQPAPAVGSSNGQPTEDTTRRAAEPAGTIAEPAAAPGPAGSDLDVWALVVRPMLTRHAGVIVTIGLSGVAAYLGARVGTRRAHRTA